MFGKKNRKSQPVETEVENVETVAKPKIETWIGANANIVGDISFTGGFSVDGSIEGNIYSDDPESTLIIGETGRIVGDAYAANIYANGRINGNVTAVKKVELHPKARIVGDLHYNLLEMAVGAGVNGKLMHQEINEAVDVALEATDVADENKNEK